MGLLPPRRASKNRARRVNHTICMYESFATATARMEQLDLKRIESGGHSRAPEPHVRSDQQKKKLTVETMRVLAQTSRHRYSRNLGCLPRPLSSQASRLTADREGEFHAKISSRLPAPAARRLRRLSEGSIRYRPVAPRRERLQVHCSTSTLDGPPSLASSLVPIRWQIVEKYPDSPYANHAKTRLAELEKAR
jgi:hypothetical protein